MKRKAKQNGSGGRMRLALLLASAAAFLLVPAATASAGPVTVIPEGTGSGTVENSSHTGVAKGETLKCHWNGTEIDEDIDGPPESPKGTGISGNGICEDETIIEILEGYFATRSADSGSEFGGAWVVEAGGTVFSKCGEKDANCTATGSTMTIRVPFALEPPDYALNLSTSGAGSGSFQCDTGSGAEACEAEYVEGTEVEVIPVDGTGSEFAEFTGDCSGSSCNLTMNEAHSVGAVFDLEPVELSVVEEGAGSGSVACEVNSTPASCNGTYTYGDTIKVVATPDAENVVDSITGPGCVIVGEGASAECEFELTAPTTVTVVFESAGTKATTPATIEGEVPITTSLEGCEAPVVLGPFVPGLAENYLGSCGLTATSTGAESELTASDESGEETGHLVQPPYKLPSALETRATGLPGLEFPGAGGSFEPLTSPVTLLTYAGPVGADAVTVFFRQHIGLHDALHTGTYAKTITLTLEQTTP